MVFAPHTRVRQVPSQQRSGDGCLTLGAECIFVLSILSYWRACLALFVLGTMSGFFLLLTFQGFSVSQCFINDHISRFLLEIIEFLKTHLEAPETSFAF